MASFDQTIQLNKAFADTAAPLNSDAYWIPVLHAAALEIQGLNAAMAALLPEPIPCNPDAEIIEEYLGLMNTVPTPEGYVTVRLPYRKLIPPPGISPQTFSFVLGTPIEDDADGNEYYACGRLA